MTGTAEPGPRGNERLTGSTVAVLLVLLAVEGLTSPCRSTRSPSSEAWVH
jgi:hypothetical protein